ncbi:MAG: hypothetical protein WDW36_001743 [Sanguina aurantia]
MQDDAYAYITLETYYVTMRDGVRLATDVYRPAFDEESDPVDSALPVVLHRTPYNKEKAARTERALLPDGSLSPPIDLFVTAERFARRGYVAVIQDCRGRYKSEGTFVKYVNEGEDGVDTLAWLVEQGWCNGKVGCFGLSYCAHVQFAMACLNPPGLACLFIESGGYWDAFHDGVRAGGAFTMKQVTWAFKNAKVSPEVMADPGVKAAMDAIDLAHWFRRLPWSRGDSPLALAPQYEEYIFHDWEADVFSEEWMRNGLYAEGAAEQMADIPVDIICSWYDPYVGSMADMFEGLTPLKFSPIRMVLGPWTHGDHALTYAGDVDFGPQSTFDRNVAPTFQGARVEVRTHSAFVVVARRCLSPSTVRVRHAGGPRYAEVYSRMQRPGDTAAQIADSVRPACVPKVCMLAFAPCPQQSLERNALMMQPIAGATPRRESPVSCAVWFDEFLHGVSAEPDASSPRAPLRKNCKPVVQYFRMGGGSGLKNAAGRLQHGGQWLTSPTWPPEWQSQCTTFFLHPDNSLQIIPPSGPDHIFTYAADPRNPVPTIGGNITSGEPIMVGGAFDQVEQPSFFGCSVPGRRICDRPDVVSFSTEALQEELEMSGQAVLTLWVSSDCPDTDFTATLTSTPPSADYPLGYSMGLCSGILRARFRDSFTDPSYLVKGQVVRLQLQLNIVSNVFMMGHRLRIDIASSNFPRYDINFHVTKEEVDQARACGSPSPERVAHNSIHIDAIHSSHVSLPLRHPDRNGDDSPLRQKMNVGRTISFSPRWKLEKLPSWER